MLNDYSDEQDILRISTVYLIELATEFIGPVTALYRITLAAANVTAVHFIAVVDSGRFLCDCLMHVNSGIPCRHYFCLLRRSQGRVAFHLGMYNARYVCLVLMRGPCGSSYTHSGGYRTLHSISVICHQSTFEPTPRSSIRHSICIPAFLSRSS